MMRLIHLLSVLPIVLGLPQFHHINRQKRSNRIVGGQDVNIEDFPHQCSMEFRSSHICGCSLIGYNVVLTAAHCTNGAQSSDLQIRAGTSTVETGGFVIKVSKLIQNPNYNDSTQENDVTVLILASSFEPSDAIKPIKIIDKNAVLKHRDPVQVSGWGAIYFTGPISPQLQAIDLFIADRTICNFVYTGQIKESMICAYSLVRDSCQGDSGGPLVSKVEKLEDRTQVGVVSWGYACALPTHPGIYSNVADLHDFIEESATKA